jgi:hypothetical protein
MASNIKSVRKMLLLLENVIELGEVKKMLSPPHKLSMRITR